jgi:DNA (cytosine-5)-methyltransferase 1
VSLTYGSLFAGVGGFDQGFDRAGMECRWQVEWDKNCQKLLRQKWPTAKHYEDITKVRAADLERVDVICGGSPCQDLSVAGKRAGMAGGRSGLFHEMVRICKRVRPRFVVWENVDGAFSSNEGRDFAAVLRAFTGIAVEVPSDGWGRAGFIKTPFPEWRWNCAWRVFDAQYFGVPQRRRRVFVVASAGDGRCAEILFEPESLRGDSPPSRGAGERITGTISSRTEGGGGLGTDFEIGGGLQITNEAR